MDINDLVEFIRKNPNVEWRLKDEELFLRDTDFNEEIKVEPEAFKKLTPIQLRRILTNGKDVDHITRVTGYMSKVSGWNKGKLGELKDRQRQTVE